MQFVVGTRPFPEEEKQMEGDDRSMEVQKDGKGGAVNKVMESD